MPDGRWAVVGAGLAASAREAGRAMEVDGHHGRTLPFVGSLERDARPPATCDLEHRTS